MSFDVDGSPVTNENHPSIWAKVENVKYAPNKVVELALELQQVLKKFRALPSRRTERQAKTLPMPSSGLRVTVSKGDPRTN